MHTDLCTNSAPPGTNTKFFMVLKKKSQKIIRYNLDPFPDYENSHKMISKALQHPDIFYSITKTSCSKPLKVTNKETTLKMLEEIIIF